MGRAIELIAADGHHLAAYRADPPSRARGGVVVLHEIFGVNRHIRDVADRLAADGYMTIAPAVFDRLHRGVELGYEPDDIAAGVDLRRRLDEHGAMLDIAAAVKAASAGRAGLVGYCMGGFLGWLASSRVDGLACAVSYYGGGILEHAAEQPRCPVLLHFADRDDDTPIERVRSLATAHPSHSVHIYAAEHGFNCDQRAQYGAEAARLARERTLAFLRQHLG